VHNLHKEISFQIGTQSLQLVREQHNLKTELPVLAGPIPQLQGLGVVKNCVECPLCSMVYMRTSLKMHYSRSHRGTSVPKNLTPVTAQRLDNGSNKQLFTVIPTLQATTMSSAEEMISELRRNRNATISAYLPTTVDDRAVSPWLLSTHWHEHVRPYKTEELMDLVALPKHEGDLDQLNSAVLDVMNLACDVMDVTDDLILQRLNTNDPVKDGWVRLKRKKYKSLV